MEIVLVLFPLYCIGYIIMRVKSKGDMFYIKKKEMVHSIPEREYLRQEVLELENELQLAEQQGLPSSMIDEIKKELESKKNRLSSLTYN